MMSKQMAFLRSGFSLILCGLLAFAGAIPAASAETPKVTIDQQTRKVTGTVKDTKGEPLIGVNVVERGTTNGTITDFNGDYSVDVGANTVLVFSYVGYLSQTIPVTGNVINVELLEDTQSLDEVVVVGYGTQQKKDITGSVAVVDTKELLKSSGSSASQQLQGKAAGVYVGTSGAPGSQTMVRIRGINTVNDNGPLYVIDGVSTRNQDLSSLNPSDIESMQVLKDASAAAIYGAQAANGVILITTKQGTKTDQPVLTYDGYVGVQKTTTKYDVLNSMDRLNLEWEAQRNNLALMGLSTKPSHPQFGTGDAPVIPNLMTVGGADGSQNINPANYSYPNNIMVPFSDTNWWDEVDRAAPIQNHQVGLSGGSDKGRYNMSANYFRQDGTVIDTYFQRYTVRANSSYNVRPWLRFGENFSYTWFKDLGKTPQGAEDTPYSWTYRASPWVPVYDIQGNFAGSKIGGTGNWRNPVAIKKREIGNYWANSRIFGNLWAEADLYKGLTYRTSYGLDWTENYHYRMSKKDLEFSESSGQNNLEEQAGFTFRWVWTNTLTYNATFNNVHKINVILGTEAIRDGLGRQVTAQRYNYLYEDNESTWVLNMGENNTQRKAESEYRGEFALFGLFGRVDYSFMDKYLITGIIRRDGVSRFSPSNRYATFPSLSLGWRLSEEQFMDSTRDWLDDLKFRIGYGQTGNSEVPRKTNFAYEFTTAPDRTNYDLTGSNTSGQLGYRLARYGNENTKWEATEMYNIGIDATILNGKFGIGAEWYTKKTKDMLLEATYSSLAGEADKPYINFGDMKNAGWDLNFNYRDSNGDFGWDASLILSHYKNEVLKLSEADDYAIWKGGTRISGNVTRTTKGRPISEFYGYKVNGFYENEAEVLALPPLGQTKETVNPAAWVGKFKFEDVNQDGDVNRGVLNENDRTVLGSPHPDLIASLNLGLTYKSFDFTMFWYSTIGNKLFNNTKYFTDFFLFGGNRSTRMRDLSWKPGADNSKAILPLLDSGDTYSGSNMSSYYVEDASFLRLKNVVIGYTLPKSLLKKATISNLRVYAQIENALTFTGYSGLDPEFTNADVSEGNGSDLRRGIDMGGWPTVMRILFGVNFAF
ncbi:MAG: TonB-dependent receptor [Tannerellaceae bacterium]|jgi:TonB-linked SusC/RagA family outer membrane protein|nr:TonB-dependent receptor [Tannerellaceae bacterium]